ncbi:MAG: hypothetical protein MK132_25315 [Lentisphaerales bacterium]|nr:hypothetical protein [Lentisphaerales bacterium]
MSQFIKFWPFRKILILSWYIFGVALTYYLAFILRFDDKLDVYMPTYTKTLPILLGCTFAFGLLFRQFSGLWRYYSIDDLVKTFLSTSCTVVVFAVITRFDLFSLNISMSRTVLVAEWILLTGWATGSRAFIR